MGTREDLPLQRATDAEHKPADEREGRDGEVHDGNRQDRDGDAEPDSWPESPSAKPVFPGECPDLDVGLSGLRAEAPNRQPEPAELHLSHRQRRSVLPRSPPP